MSQIFNFFRKTWMSKIFNFWPKDLDVRKTWTSGRPGRPGTWTSGDLDVRGPGRPEDLDVRKTWMSGDLDVRGPGCPGTWMSGDLDVRGPGCPGTWTSGTWTSKTWMSGTWMSVCQEYHFHQISYFIPQKICCARNQHIGISNMSQSLLYRSSKLDGDFLS